MEREELLKEISIKTPSKIFLIVLDGVGGIPFKEGKTELEYANIPNLDELAKKSVLGQTDPILPGITPGSGPAHLALFGYDPLKYQIGRGVLENLGLGVEVKKGDIAIRGNFCTLKDGLIVDRRAGRIFTEENKRLCSKLRKRIKKTEGVEILFTPGMEYRFALRLRGKGLEADVSDADPQTVGKPPVVPMATNRESKKTAKIAEKIINLAKDVLKDENRANFILLRGFSTLPPLPSMQELFRLNPAAIATYPMYKGLAKLVGMEVLKVNGMSIADEIETLKKQYKEHDFFYFHVKKTDSYGEDGKFEKKVTVIEEFDRFLPEILSLSFDVLVITSDHSTPCLLKAHSWHPNPFLLYANTIIPDEQTAFSEHACTKGGLGRFFSVDAMSLMLGHALKLKKFGA
jgi:2,3-bisphosphoglycerate-independent phosphoglycerate mutase